jgi:hypothetical protein
MPYLSAMLVCQLTSLLAQHLRYDSSELLQSLQATVIYLLLQAEDPDSVEANDTMSLVETICVRTLHKSCAP